MGVLTAAKILRLKRPEPLIGTDRLRNIFHRRQAAVLLILAVVRRIA